MRLSVPSLRASLILVALLLGSRPATVAGEPERTTCRHWAVLLPEDAGQHRTYDGIRKGLEVAQLERLCLKDLADDEAAFRAFVAEHRALPAPTPLVFAVGRRAGDRLLAAGFEGPGVYVSSAVTVGGLPLTPEPALPPGVGRARGDIPAEVLGSALSDLLGVKSPVVWLAWEATTPEAAAAAERLLKAAGLVDMPVSCTPPHTVPPQALLYLRLGLGERLFPWAQVVAEAKQGKFAVLSDDPAHYGTGAALVLTPDHALLGRLAAEAGRRLWRGEVHGSEPLVARDCRILVDLDACAAQGVVPPVTFLARVHGVRSSAARGVPLAPAGAR